MFFLLHFSEEFRILIDPNYSSYLDIANTFSRFADSRAGDKGQKNISCETAEMTFISHRYTHASKTS